MDLGRVQPDRTRKSFRVSTAPPSPQCSAPLADLYTAFCFIFQHLAAERREKRSIPEYRPGSGRVPPDPDPLWP